MYGRMSPIGVFDSGLGGLSVLRELRPALPAEDVLYYADSAYCPYGVRPAHEIRERCAAIVAGLLDRGAKLIIVACNTASSVALTELRARFPVPIIGMEPAVKPAAALTRTSRIAVLATPRTVAGQPLAQLIRAHARGADVLTIPAPGLADLVEAGYTAGPQIEATLRPLLEPLAARAVDVLVLGCTHYPFLREPIRDMVGPGIQVIDSGEAIARRAVAVLTERGQLRTDSHPGRLDLFTSAPVDQVAAVANRLLGQPVDITHLPL